MKKLTPEQLVELAADIRTGKMGMEPASHGERLAAMLDEERLWEISRETSWGWRLPLAMGPSGPQIGDGLSGEGSGMFADTWLTSALWPLAELGWPDIPENLEGFYPNSWLETGYDISFFWGARMCMACKALTGRWPFAGMWLHGLIRDSQGRKFSKSLGNGIDPLEICATHGADALRMYCARKALPGADFRHDPGELSGARSDCIKTMSAARLLSERCGRWGGLGEEPEEAAQSRLRFEERMLSRDFRGAILGWSKDLRGFCSGWLEERKGGLGGGDGDIAQAWLASLLIQIHPFAPHLSCFLLSREWESGDGRMF